MSEMAYPPTLAERGLSVTIQDKSRLDLAMRAYTVATARMKALEQEAGMAFREYHDARERLEEEHGVSCDLELSPGISAAYSAYKQDLARAEGRRVVDEDA